MPPRLLQIHHRPPSSPLPIIFHGTVPPRVIFLPRHRFLPVHCHDKDAAAAWTLLALMWGEPILSSPLSCSRVHLRLEAAVVRFRWFSNSLLKLTWCYLWWVEIATKSEDTIVAHSVRCENIAKLMWFVLPYSCTLNGRYSSCQKKRR
jgi:hypothetical protein